jgi:hypothetical protein
MEADNQFAAALFEPSDHSGLDDVRELVIHRHKMFSAAIRGLIPLSDVFVLGHILALLSLGKEP